MTKNALNLHEDNASPIDADPIKNGQIVFVIKDWTREKINAWVNELMKRSGQKIDWYYEGNNALIMGLGDLEKIRYKIKVMLPDLNREIKSYYNSSAGLFFNPANFYTAADVDDWACVAKLSSIFSA